MTLNTKILIAGISVAGTLAGCASVAPAQLVSARAAYTASSDGLAAKLSPTDLYDAKKSLDQANKEFATTATRSRCATTRTSPGRRSTSPT